MTDKVLTTCTYLLSFLVGMVVAIIIMHFWSTKFCPECGHHYNDRIEYCQYDGAALKEIRN